MSARATTAARSAESEATTWKPRAFANKAGAPAPQNGSRNVDSGQRSRGSWRASSLKMSGQSRRFPPR